MNILTVDQISALTGKSKGYVETGIEYLIREGDIEISKDGKHYMQEPKPEYMRK